MYFGEYSVWNAIPVHLVCGRESEMLITFSTEITLELDTNFSVTNKCSTQGNVAV